MHANVNVFSKECVQSMYQHKYKTQVKHELCSIFNVLSLFYSQLLVIFKIHLS